MPLSPRFGADENSQSIVLSYSVWKTAFDGDKGVLGHAVIIDETSFTVIGVMPPGFSFPVGDGSIGQLWTSVKLGKEDQNRSITAMKYEAIGRLRRGRTLDSARDDLQTIQRTIASQYTDPRIRDEHSKVTLLRYSDSLVSPDLRNALLARLLASAVLWLIANFNVTNLILARSTARQREIAIRGALGASRRRVAQQMIIESLVLSGAAAIIGACVAASCLKLLTHALQSHLSIAIPAVPNIPILVALIGLTMFSALVSAGWPTLMAMQAPIEPVLKQDGTQTGASRRQQWVRSGLVTLEMALSLTLLVSCGLLLRTIYPLRHVPLGFRTDHIVVANLSIPSFRFAGRDMTSTLYEPLLERVRHLPGVQSAGLMSEVPLGQTFALKLILRANGQKAPTYLKAVNPGVQDVFGFRMAAGRFFGPEDTPTSETALVVNQAFARLYSPDSYNPEEILGKKLFSSDRGFEDSGRQGTLRARRPGLPACSRVCAAVLHAWARTHTPQENAAWLATIAASGADPDVPCRTSEARRTQSRILPS